MLLMLIIIKNALLWSIISHVYKFSATIFISSHLTHQKLGLSIKRTHSSSIKKKKIFHLKPFQDCAL